MSPWWQAFFFGACAGLFLGGPILTVIALICIPQQEFKYEHPDQQLR